MTTAATTICNLALSQVPAGAITSLDEASVAGRACKLWYAPCVEELMAKASWQFAVKRAAMAAKINDRANEWTNAYAVPAYMAFPLQVLDATGTGRLDYEFSGSTIYTNAPEAWVEFVSTQDFTSAYDGLFRAALVALLASRVCVPITKNTKREAELVKASEVAIERAQAANFNLNPVRYMNHIPDALQARHGDFFPDRVYEGPEANYPDFDPVETFQNELD